jgi:uncharacterized protein with PIN domain
MAAPSKYDTLRAMREARYEKPRPVTATVTKRAAVTPDVTRCPACGHQLKTYASNAAKQRAYRERKAKQAVQ